MLGAAGFGNHPCLRLISFLGAGVSRAVPAMSAWHRAVAYPAGFKSMIIRRLWCCVMKPVDAFVGANAAWTGFGCVFLTIIVKIHK
jgi:hypothetical protein